MQLQQLLAIAIAVLTAVSLICMQAISSYFLNAKVINASGIDYMP